MRSRLLANQVGAVQMVLANASRRFADIWAFPPGPPTAPEATALLGLHQGLVGLMNAATSIVGDTFEPPGPPNCPA